MVPHLRGAEVEYRLFLRCSEAWLRVGRAVCPSVLCLAPSAPLHACWGPGGATPGVEMCPSGPGLEEDGPAVGRGRARCTSFAQNPQRQAGRPPPDPGDNVLMVCLVPRLGIMRSGGQELEPAF